MKLANSKLLVLTEELLGVDHRLFEHSSATMRVYE